MTTPEEFRDLLERPEGARVEFKEASGGFHFDELVKYCVAMANEGGGRIVLAPSWVPGRFGNPGERKPASLSVSGVTSGSRSSDTKEGVC